MDLGKQVGYLSGEEDKEPSRFGRAISKYIYDIQLLCIINI